MDILITQLQLHDALKGAEERLVEVEVRRLVPVHQHFGEDVVDEGDSLLRHVSLLVTGSLQGKEKYLCPNKKFAFSQTLSRGVSTTRY